MPRKADLPLDSRGDLLAMLRNDPFYKRFDLETFAKVGKTTRFASTMSSTSTTKLEHHYIEQNTSASFCLSSGYDLDHTIGINFIAEWATNNRAEALESQETLSRCTKQRKREISGYELNLRIAISEMFEALANRFADVRLAVDDNIVKRDGELVDRALYHALCDALRQASACYTVLRDEIWAPLENVRS